MTDKEYVAVSFDREGLAAHLEAIGYSVKGGLTEEDTASLAAAYGEALDALSAAGDVFIDTMQEVLGDRLTEEDS